MVIVTVDTATPSTARVGADSITVNVSSASTAPSPATVTVMSWDVCPAVNVTVPEVAV